MRKGNDLFYVKKYGRSSAGCFKRVGASSRGMSEREIEYAMRKVIVAKTDICDIPSRQSDFTFRKDGVIGARSLGVLSRELCCFLVEWFSNHPW